MRRAWCVVASRACHVRSFFTARHAGLQRPMAGFPAGFSFGPLLELRRRDRPLCRGRRFLDDNLLALVLGGRVSAWVHGLARRCVRLQKGAPVVVRAVGQSSGSVTHRDRRWFVDHGSRVDPLAPWPIRTAQLRPSQVLPAQVRSPPSAPASPAPPLPAPRSTDPPSATRSPRSNRQGGTLGPTERCDG